MTVYLDISVGPVQTFVAQSRRTRDLWGSSYLLSFLSAHAMKAVLDRKGEIIRPGVTLDDAPLLRWISDRGQGEPPRVGSVPNHFIVRVEREGSQRELAAAARDALLSAWGRVCATVWDTYVRPMYRLGQGTEAIWARQVEPFWELVWVVGETEEGLSRHRKYWRTHRLPDEPGDKCMVMPELQELSGHVGARGEREGQKGFWQALRGSRRLGPLDLGEGERLSAVALVKRLYPRVAKQALGWKVDTSHWPSTVYVAALPWVREVATNQTALARAYAAAVREQEPEVIAEKRPLLAGPQCEGAGDFARLDANYFHATFIEDPRLCPLGGSGEDKGPRKALVEQLRALVRANGKTPPTSYAMLLADGDRLGALVETLGGGRVGDALRVFTRGVEGIVRGCDGVTIYAGGDDVLAMLPVPRALECAQRLSGSYEAAFAELAERPATLSAALCFAHIRAPLRSVMRECHRLLDDVAKEQNGRASLTAAVLKRGGLHCEWTTTWTRKGGASCVDRVARLVSFLEAGEDEPGFSSSLLYRLYETLGLLCGWPQWRPGMWAQPLDGLDLQSFLAAELRRSVAEAAEGVEKGSRLYTRVEEITELLVDLISRSRNPAHAHVQPDRAVGLDALMLARFLASGGVEEGGT